MTQVLVRKKAQKELATLPPKYRQRILQALLALEESPLVGKSLTGSLDGYRSLRVWPYRIIYVYLEAHDEVYVVRIGHRQGVYGPK